MRVQPGAACAVAASLLLGAPAHAQPPSPLAEWQYSAGQALEPFVAAQVPEWQGMAGIAGESAPRYEGARGYEASFGPIAELRFRDIAFASSVEGLGVNLLHGKGYRAGLALTYDLGRDEDNDRALAGLGDIHRTSEAKAFAEYVAFPLVTRVDLRRALGGHGGWTADLGGYVPVIGQDTFVLMVGPSVTWADAENLQRSFGVDSAQASRSGYPAYAPGAGIRDVRLGATAAWFLGDHWLVNFSGAGERLVSRAAQSPLVQTPRQYVGSAVLAYRW